MRYLPNDFKFYMFRPGELDAFAVVLAPTRREALKVVGMTLDDFRNRKIDVWSGGRNQPSGYEVTRWKQSDFFS